MSRVLLLHERDESIVNRLEQIVRGEGHSIILPRNEPLLGRTIAESVTEKIRESDIVVVVISEGYPNIYYELGVSYAFGKPSLLLVNEQLMLPSDIAGTRYIKYDNHSVKSKSFEFKVRENLKDVASKALSLKKETANIQDQIPNRVVPQRDSIPDLLRTDGYLRAQRFEAWLASLASEIPGWDIVRRASKSKDVGYDFAVWNNIDDTILSALGNPIIFELKSTRRVEVAQLLNMLHAAKRMAVNGFVLATLGEVSSRALHRIESAYNSDRIIPVILDRSDLLKIETPRDLVDQIRTKASAILQSGGSGV